MSDSEEQDTPPAPEPEPSGASVASAAAEPGPEPSAVAKRWCARAQRVSARFQAVQSALDRGGVEHMQQLNSSTASHLRNRSEYRMYVMAVDALHFRHGLAGAELLQLRRLLRRLGNRTYGDCYIIYKLSVEHARFPSYHAADAGKDYPLESMEDMMAEMEQLARSHTARAAAPPHTGETHTTPLERCIAHSTAYIHSYNALLLQTATDLMLMHEKELLHLEAQTEALARLLGLPPSSVEDS